MEDTILKFDRDWEIIKEKFLSDMPEEEREAFLTIIIKSAVYN